MAFITSSGVFGAIIDSMHVPATNQVHLLPDCLLLLGSCIQFVVHAIFFVAYVVPLAWRCIRCRLGDVDRKLLPAPAWFPSIVGIASIVAASERLFPADEPDPNLPAGVDSDLVLMTVRCIMWVALANAAVFVPVVTARSWSDVRQHCKTCTRALKVCVPYSACCWAVSCLR